MAGPAFFIGARDPRPRFRYRAFQFLFLFRRVGLVEGFFELPDLILAGLFVFGATLSCPSLESFGQPVERRGVELHFDLLRGATNRAGRKVPSEDGFERRAPQFFRAARDASVRYFATIIDAHIDDD